MTGLANRYPQPDVLEALGALVVSFSALEETLKAAIARLAGNKVILADVLTTGLNASVLIEKFGALYYEYHPDALFREEVQVLCGQLAELNSERNTLIHSLWIIGQDTGGWRRQKAAARVKHGLHFHMTDMKAEVIWDLISRLEAADDRVVELALSRRPPAN